MGGDRESFVAKNKTHIVGRGSSVGQIRIHISDGEVHFHDDTAKLKAAVPVDIWYLVWNKLLSRDTGAWAFADAVNETLLSVKTLFSDRGDKAEIDAIVEVKPLAIKDGIKNLQYVTTGK
jgi:hypothetical protein